MAQPSRREQHNTAVPPRRGRGGPQRAWWLSMLLDMHGAL